MNGGPSALYTDPLSSGMAVVPLDGPGPVRKFPSNLTPGSGFGATLGAGRTRDRRPGLPRRGDKSLAIPARRLRAETRDDVHVGADPELPMVTRREDARDVARNAESADVVLITSEETDRKGAGSH